MRQKLINLMIDRIASWTDEDIYAISLYVYDECDNPCKPTVTLGYNTETQVRVQMASEVKWKPVNETEARWNYAFWIQNAFFCFGEGDTARDVREWMTTRCLPFYEDDDEAWDDDCVYEECRQITKEFVSELVAIVQEIHARGILTKKFGRELPILIHELEYYPEIAQQNMQANGDALPEAFVTFCCGE